MCRYEQIIPAEKENPGYEEQHSLKSKHPFERVLPVGNQGKEMVKDDLKETELFSGIKTVTGQKTPERQTRTQSQAESTPFIPWVPEDYLLPIQTAGSDTTKRTK